MAKEELVVEEPVVEEEAVEEEQKPELTPEQRKKAALTSFILGIVAFVLLFVFGWGLVALILAAICLGKNKKAKGELAGASKVFYIIGKVLGIVTLILSILHVVMMVLLVIAAIVIGGIYLVIFLIGVIPALVEGASALLLL